MSFSGYPKALSYAFGRMEGFSKITQRVEPNRTDGVLAGSTIKVNIEPNTLWGLRSFSMYYKFSVNYVGLTPTDNFCQNRFAPRLSSSIIDSASIYMNNNLVDHCSDYNLLYNTLHDFSSGGDQVNKRFLENNDPSVKFHDLAGANTSTLSKRNSTLTNSTSDYSDVERPFVINNWVNFLGNSAVEYLDTNSTGLTTISLRLAPSTICWRSGKSTNTVTSVSLCQYQLDDIYFTYSKIVFKDTLYEQILNANLMEDPGLRIKFTGYETHTSALSTRNINFTFNTNASSLDTIIATTRRIDYATENYLQISGAEDGTLETITYDRGIYLNAPDLFNQSIYFRRDLSDLATSQFFINGTAMSQRALTPQEVWNETSIALNDHNDLSNSCHKGLNSMGAFLKYYFAHIVSLNYTGETAQPMISGLNGGGASFNIIWRATSGGTCTSPVFPIVFTGSSKVLVVNAGKQISVEI